MVFSSFTAIHGETALGNEETAAAVRQHPNRLYGYCVVNPNYPQETMRQLERCFAPDTNFVGLKLHCQLHHAQLHDLGYGDALAFADAHALPVLVHGGGEDRWDEIVTRYPNASFIMAHACAWDGHAPWGRSMYKRVRRFPNLYVDVSGSPAHRGAMSALVELVGADKILFGSDFPMFDLAFELARVSMSGLPNEATIAICCDNARRIFNRLMLSQNPLSRRRE